MDIDQNSIDKSVIVEDHSVRLENAERKVTNYLY